MSSTLKKMMSKKMLAITFLSLASGIPLGITVTLIQTWLTDAGIDLKTIGLASLVQLPYTLKFLWAPFMDRFTPFGSRRKGWMYISQAGMFCAIVLLGQFDPQINLTAIMALSFAVAFFGASHDVVVDAYKRDVFDEDEIGFGSAAAINAYTIGYRFLTVVLGMALADFTSWHNVFLIFAFICIIGTIGAFIAPSPTTEVSTPKNINEAIINPFLNYLKRPGAIEILIFILLYKVGDNFAANLLTTFYLKIGFVKTEIAAIGKLVGFWATFIGTMIGGTFLMKYSVRKCLLFFGFFQALSTIGFAILNEVVIHEMFNKHLALGIFVGFENLTSGMGTAAFAAFMLLLTDRKFSATQYALLTSFMGIPRVVLPSWAGFVAEPLGWTGFFIFSTVIALPGMLMVYFRGKRWEQSLPT